VSADGARPRARGLQPRQDHGPGDAGRGASASPEDEHKVLGARLREARETLGLVQADTAGALDIPRTSVAAMEAGTRKVTGLELRRLARLYRRPVGWLLGEDDAVPAAAAASGGRDVLFRATEPLSEQDREQVLRFAQFLAARSITDAPSPGSGGGPRRPRPRPPASGQG
jgi:transcriptional regulator with XRE-family HTH domain